MSSPRHEIESVLISLKWENKDIDEALSLLSPVISSDVPDAFISHGDTLTPRQIASLLHVDIESQRARYKQEETRVQIRKKDSDLFETVLVCITGLVISVAIGCALMYIAKIGYFQETI